MGRPNPRGLRPFVVPMVLCFCALSVSMLWLNWEFYHDDAYITLRYARNLLDGRGIVWNPGEYVQGYTNPLHLLLIGALGALGVDLWAASRALGLLALGGLAVAVCFSPWCLDHQWRSHSFRLLPLALVGTSAPMLVWSLGGLEGGLFSTLCFLAAMAFQGATKADAKRPLLMASGLLFSLAALTRPDGIVFLSVSLAWLLAHRRSRRVSDIVAFLSPCVLLLLPYLAWARFYYGDFLPNTYYLKAADVSIHRVVAGLRYVAWYAVLPPFQVLLVALACAFVRHRARLSPPVIYLLALTAGYALFVVYVGGDHMQSFRLLLPIIPLSALALSLLLSALIPREARRAVAWVYCLAAVLSTAQVAFPSLNPGEEDPASRVGTRVGRYIAKHWPENALIALNTAGSTPYHSINHRYIDMLGVNDRHIAKRGIGDIELPNQNWAGHTKGDGAYVLSREPGFIIVGPAEGTSIRNPWFLSDKEMSRDPRFGSRYVMREVSIDGDGAPSHEQSLVFTYYEKVSEQSPSHGCPASDAR